MTRLLRLTSCREFLPVLSVSLLALFTGLALLGASAWLVASAALMPPLYTLALGITTVRACGIGRAVFRYGERYLSHRMAFRILTEIRLALYDQAAEKLPLRSGPARQGEFLHDLLTGADELRDFYVRALLPILAITTITLITAWLLSQILGIAALLLPALCLLRLLLACLGRPAEEKKRRTLDAAYRSALLDISSGADELIRAGFSPAKRRLAQPAQALLQGDLRLAYGDARRDTGANLLDTLILMILLGLLIHCVTQNTLSGIDLCVWLLILQTLIAEIRTLPEAVRQGRRSLAAAIRLPSKKSLLAIPAAEKPGKSAAVPATGSGKNILPLLSVQDLSFSYRAGQDLLHGLSFTVEPGQHTAIIGASGSGKTTLAQLLLGVWPPDQGELLLQGQPYRCLAPAALRHAIAALPQGSILFSASIRENFVRYRPGLSEEAMLAALADAQLLPVINQLPQGIDTPLGENASGLSGGQRNRLLTALAIAGPEPLILLDEPTCGLDPEMIDALMSHLFARVRQTGQTLLVITHERNLLREFSQVIELRQ